jgi:hypothetical protein
MQIQSQPTGRSEVVAKIPFLTRQIVRLGVRPLKTTVSHHFGGCLKSAASCFWLWILLLATFSFSVAPAALASNSAVQANDPAYTFTTLAGLAGQAGSTDGTRSAARFKTPLRVAVDSAGYVYVADEGNGTIRKITPEGLVSTLAGMAGSPGSADGIGSVAQFNSPEGVAVDSMGNVYVGDTYNRTIRKITPNGEVSTLAGMTRTIGSADGIGSAAGFWFPVGVPRASTLRPAWPSMWTAIST